jgi:hypothetical protein
MKYWMRLKMGNFSPVTSPQIYTGWGDEKLRNTRILFLDKETSVPKPKAALCKGFSDLGFDKDSQQGF